MYREFLQVISMPHVNLYGKHQSVHITKDPSTRLWQEHILQAYQAESQQSHPRRLIPTLYGGRTRPSRTLRHAFGPCTERPRVSLYKLWFPTFATGIRPAHSTTASLVVLGILNSLRAPNVRMQYIQVVHQFEDNEEVPSQGYDVWNWRMKSCRVSPSDSLIQQNHFHASKKDKNEQPTKR